MNLRALRVFVGLMDDGTLTRAATRMHLSQSAASRLLSILEAELGAPLFARDGRRMRPTAAAEALYPEAVRILSQVGALPDLIASAYTPPSLRVICQTRLVSGLAVPAIARFAAAHPERRVRLEAAPRRELARRLLAGRHDVAIATLPLPVEETEAEPLGTLPLGILLPREHPLADRGELATADLADVPYVALDESTVVRRMVDAAGRGALPPPVIEVSTGSAAYRLVATGLGFTVADRIAVEPELWSRLALVPWRDAPEVTVGAARARADADANERAASFVDALRQAIGTARDDATRKG